MPTNKQIKAAGGNDVGEWGDAAMPSYSEPFEIDGEPIDFDRLPKFGSEPTERQDNGRPDSPSPLGDLNSTGADGDFGDIFESQRVPLRPS